MEKNVLLDNSLSEIFCSFENLDFVTFFLEKLKIVTGKRFFDAPLIRKNESKVRKFLLDFSNFKEINPKSFLEKFGACFIISCKAIRPNI